MKSILIILLLTPLFGLSADHTDFIVQNKNGYWCITHQVQKEETIKDLAKYFFVRTSVLAGVNNLSSESALVQNQPLLIPLLETNYHKMTGLSSQQSGYYPLYYFAQTDENVSSICQKFQLNESDFFKWNPIVEKNGLANNDKVMIGWIRCYSQVNNGFVQTKLVSKQNSKPNISASKTMPEANIKVVENGSDEHADTKVVNPDKPKVSSVSKIQSKPHVQKTIEPQPKLLKFKNTKPSYIYHENEKKGIGSKISAFFGRVKSKALSKRDIQKKNDQSVDAEEKKVVSAEKKKAIVESKELSRNQSTKSIKHKRSLAEIWSLVVNGKERKPNASSQASSLPNSTAKTVNRINDSKNIQSNIDSKIKQSNNLSAKQKHNENVKQEVSNKVAIKEDKKEINSLDTYSKKAQQKKKDIKSSSNLIDKSESSKQNTAASLSIVKKAEKNLESVAEIDKSNVEIPVRNEIKSLSLNKSINGKCAYFFSGPTSGQFYAFTNIGSKGEVIKITNPLNGRFIFAEIIGSLSPADLHKGIVIKLSDNAKLPLGQKSTLFNVKVNY